MPQSVPFILHPKNKVDGDQQMATTCMGSTVCDQALVSLPHLQGLEDQTCLLYEHIFFGKVGLKAAERLSIHLSLRESLSIRNGVLLLQQLHCSESCKDAASATILMLHQEF
jgi:hypothetical protein